MSTIHIRHRSLAVLASLGFVIFCINGVLAQAQFRDLYGSAPTEAREQFRPLFMDPVAIVATQEIVVYGERFTARVLRDRLTFGGPESLQISTSTGPLVSLATTGNEHYPIVTLPTGFSYGGHTFEVLFWLDQYEIDGFHYTLPEGVTYKFLDGILTGISR